jgi:hypothetical protein
MGPWRPVFTCVYAALLQRRFGTKFLLESTLTVYWGSNRKPPYKSCLGGRRPLAKRPHQKRFNVLVIYTFWNLWKERNIHIFNNNSETVWRVAARIKDDIEQRKGALR